MSVEEQREFIIRDAADRLSLLEGDVGVEEMTGIMMERLAEMAGAEIINYARLGRIIATLNRDLEAENPKGSYGIGKVFRAGFEQIGKATGRAGTDAQIEAATDVLLDKFLSKVYELAGVERA